MKSSHNISLLLLCAGIAIGGGGMYLTHVSTSTNKKEDTAQHSIEPTSVKGSTSTGTRQFKHETNLHSSSYNQSATSLENPTLHYNSFERSLAVYSYVAGLSSADELTNELYASASEARRLSHRVKGDLQTALVEKLAIVNPNAVVKFFDQPKITRNDFAFTSMVQDVFNDLASSNLNKAISIANTLNTDAKSSAISGILAAQVGQSLTTLQRIAKELGDASLGVDFYLASLVSAQIDDPQTAWSEVVPLHKPNDPFHSRALLNIAQSWYEQDGLDVINEISAATLNDNFKRGTIQHILSLAAEDIPEQAFRFAMKLPDNNAYDGIREMVARSWTTSDPRAAFKAVSNIKHSGHRENLQGIVVFQWAGTEPKYVLENLNSFPPSVRQYAIDDAIQVIARTSPKEAAELTLEHGYVFSGSSLPSDVMEEWIKQDVEAAVNWVYNGPLSEKNSYEWVSALTSNLVHSDPLRAFDLAVTQKIPKNGEFAGMFQIGLEAEVIHQLARQNIDLAIELLPKVREGNTRLSAYEFIGDRCIVRGDSKNVINLGLLLPDSDQAEYFLRIATTWARVDPVGLVEAIKDFPTEEIRSRVVTRLSNNWYRKNFTELQFDALSQYLRFTKHERSEE